MPTPQLIRSAVVLTGLFLSTAVLAGSPKTSSTFYPARARANAVANAQRYDWARQHVQEAEKDAEPWVQKSDDELWSMVFSPRLKRAIAVNVDAGCPKCGKGIYGDRGSSLYAWTGWVPGHPWKIQCPNCKELFPKNDFGAFYQSGISPEDGLFHPERADRTLLFNTEHPDPSDPLHTWGVDDGSGWQRTPGGLNQRDWFIGYHVYFGLNAQITAAVRALATAYVLTDKPIYAHKAVILLDRLADVFPEYDGKNEQLFNNVWGRYSEGIIGPSYWDGGMWSQRAIDYDMIYDGIAAAPEAVAFLRAKAERFKVPRPKRSVQDIRDNIKERILIEPGRHPDRIDMNGAITQMCRATVDLVLRGQDAVPDLVRVHLPAIVPPEHLNDDGSGNERSTGYDRGAFNNYCTLVERLYDMDPALARAALEGYPRLHAAFDFWPDLWCLEKFIPNIGDTGAPGSTSGLPGTAGAYLALFDLTGEPRYAQVALRIVGGKAENLPRNIHAEDPEALVRRAIEADRTAGGWPERSVVKPDFKLGILRAGKGDARMALWLFYSPAAGTSSHSHFDALTIGLYAFGVEAICEQGYPLYTGGWPARSAWTSHTRSHAGVVVDGRCQTHCPGGKLLGFEEHGPARWIAAEARCAYNLARYRRTLALIEASDGNCFALDVFRVQGGREHTWTLPVFYAERTTAGLTLAPHGDVYDGYVTRVQSAPADAAWWVDHALRDAWKGKVAGHLRVHGAPLEGATVLLGEGETRLGRDATERLPYLLIRRKTDAGELESTFVVVYEPYRDRPFLADRALKTEISPGHVRAQVTRADGQVQTVLIEDGDPEKVRVRVETP